MIATNTKQVKKAHNLLLTAQLKHLDKNQSNVDILRLYDALVKASEGVCFSHCFPLLLRSFTAFLRLQKVPSIPV